MVATADFGYPRLRAVGYSDDDRRRWLTTIGAVGAGWRDACVFFKHEDAGTGPALARRVLMLDLQGGPAEGRRVSGAPGVKPRLGGGQ